MSLKLFAMSSISLLHRRFSSAIFKDLCQGRTLKHCTFLSHYFHTSKRLPQATSSFLTINTHDLYNISCNRMMAGHAKWQNVKHIKEAKDKQKSMVCNKYAFLLRSAVRG